MRIELFTTIVMSQCSNECERVAVYCYFMNSVLLALNE